MKKRSIIFSIAYGLSFVLGIFILSVNLFMDRKKQYWMYYGFPISKWIIFLVGLIIAIAIIIIQYRIYKLDTSDSNSRFSLTLLVMSLVLFAFELVIVYEIRFDLGWDVSYLKDAATEYMNGNLSEFSRVYFENNPNNIFMYFIIICFLKIGTLLGLDGYSILTHFGVFLNCMASVLLSLTVRKLSGKNAQGIVAFALGAILFGFSPWLIAPYTDVFSICITILSFYVFITVRQKNMNPYLKSILVVIIPAVFFLLKPTNIFVLFSVFAYEIVLLIKGGNKREKLLQIILGIALTLLIIVVARVGVYRIVGYEENEAVKKPFQHYLLLGSNKNMVGQYSSPDDEYTVSFEGLDAKKEADITLVKERYKEMGVTGYLQHLCRKTYLNYANGIFGWGKEAGFVKTIQSSDNTLGRFLQDIYYVGGDDLLIQDNSFSIGGKYFSIYTSISQVNWFVILILITYNSLMSFVKEIHKGSLGEVYDVKAIAVIAMLGMFVFLSLFETNARYLYSMLPIYVLFCIIYDVRDGKY